MLYFNFNINPSKFALIYKSRRISNSEFLGFIVSFSTHAYSVCVQFILHSLIYNILAVPLLVTRLLNTNTVLSYDLETGIMARILENGTVFVTSSGETIPLPSNELPKQATLGTINLFENKTVLLHRTLGNGPINQPNRNPQGWFAICHISKWDKDFNQGKEVLPNKKIRSLNTFLNKYNCRIKFSGNFFFGEIIKSLKLLRNHEFTLLCGCAV